MLDHADEHFWNVIPESDQVEQVAVVEVVVLGHDELLNVIPESDQVEQPVEDNCFIFKL